MSYHNELTVSPNWPAFSRLWKIVAIALFLLLFLLWLLNASPWSKNGGICGEAPADPAERIVAAPDSLAPVLNLSDNSVVHVPFGTSYSDAGATAMDNIDSDISVLVTGEVDYNTAGECVLTYTATDRAGNTSSTTRTVIVDAEPISLESASLEPVASAVADLPAAAKLYFGNASAVLPADSSSTIADVIAYLGRNTNSSAVISGFHSAVGNYEYNQGLSKRRAESVSQLLQKAGIDADRITLEKPVETTGSGSDEEARRVEVSVR